MLPLGALEAFARSGKLVKRGSYVSDTVSNLNFIVGVIFC